MNRSLAVLALAAICASPAVAQQDSTAAYKGEIRLGVTLGSHGGDLVATGAPVSTSASVSGLELLARIDGVGILLRSQSAGPTPDGGSKVPLTSREARFLLGTRTLSLELGALERNLPGSEGDEKATFGRVGLRSQWEIGGSGFDVALNAGAHFDKTEESNSAKLTYRGHDAEVLLLYRFIQRFRIPAFAAAGWRVNVIDDEFAPNGTTLSQSGVVISVGIRLGN